LISPGSPAADPTSGSGGTVLVAAGTEATFVASDAGTQTSWTFGDGTNSSTASPRATHTYGAPGRSNWPSTSRGTPPDQGQRRCSCANRARSTNDASQEKKARFPGHAWASIGCTGDAKVE
jgi:hypothetical protein